MRVFVALACPADLLPVVERYRDLVADVPGTRMLDGASLHVTLIGPWEEKDPDAVVRDFSAIASPSISLTFDVAEERQDGELGSTLVIKGPSTPKLERLSLQTWRAIKSHDPPSRPLPHMSLARLAPGAHLPAVPPMPRSTATFDRLCLYEAGDGLTSRILGERKLEEFMLPSS